MAAGNLSGGSLCATLESVATPYTYTKAVAGPGYLLVHNAGEEPIAISVGGSVTNTAPGVPVQADGEIILNPGVTLNLPGGVGSFVHRTATSETSTLVVVVQSA